MRCEDWVTQSFEHPPIEAFQRLVVKIPKPDGRVDVKGTTLRLLRNGLSAGFSEAKLRGIMIHATLPNIKKYFSALNLGMATNGINSPLRMAHFLAQLGHESGELKYSEEISSGEAYEGRIKLGNTEAGDGKLFKGRGLIQLTGRTNYKKYGDARGKDYLSGDNPKLLATDTNVSVDAACWFWVKNGLNAAADADDILKITMRINGGTNGLDERKRLLAREKYFLMR